MKDPVKRFRSKYQDRYRLGTRIAKDGMNKFFRRKKKQELKQKIFED